MGTDGISLGPYKLRLHISIRTHTHPPRSKATPLYFDLKNGRQEEYTVGHPLSNETHEILFYFLSEILFTNSIGLHNSYSISQQHWNMLQNNLQNI